MPFYGKLGGRVEQFSHDVDNNFFAQLSQQNPIFFDKKDYTAISGSAGAVWTLNDQSSIAFNYAYSERAPSASEMFSYGPHIGSGTFEIGGGFQIAEKNGEYNVIQTTQRYG